MTDLYYLATLTLAAASASCSAPVLQVVFAVGWGEQGTQEKNVYNVRMGKIEILTLASCSAGLPAFAWASSLLPTPINVANCKNDT
jgi:hypothetical protein